MEKTARKMTAPTARATMAVRRLFSIAMNLRLRWSTGSNTEMNGTSL